MNILSKEQIKEIRELQKELDIRIRENNDIPLNVDLSLEKYLALKTELFEFVNEIESFKYWKKSKGKEHILEEACDTLHFIMSLAIDNDVEVNLEHIKYEEENLNNCEINESLGIMDAMISDAYAEKEWELLSVVLLLMLIVLNKCGYNSDELYQAYIEKNKVNHERQDKQY